jgi:hypothetical protein
MIDYLPEAIFILVCLIIGVTLLVGTYNRWRWLINPSTKRWWYYPPSTLKRIFGSRFLVFITYCVGLFFFVLGVLFGYGGVKCISYEKQYNIASPAEPGIKVFTGISVEELEVCVDDSKGKLLEISKSEDVFKIRIRDFFYCDRQQKRPYLFVGSDNKYTLVLSSKYPLLFATACDCTKDMTINIKYRLQSGTTLKVLSDGEVLGHLIVP